MPDAVKLIGLDFGTTTSSAVVADARLTRGAVAGRVELNDIRECYRSELIFTPLDASDRLDEGRLEEHLDAWLAAGDVRTDEVFGGGALLTGLTARAENAAALVRLVRRRLDNTLVATADDPCLESWLAFMGSCGGLSRAHPELAVLNLDVGGGTTNLALGKAGEVLATGCLFVGARHVRVAPGGYKVVKVSPFARALFDHRHIYKGPDDCLTDADVQAVLDFYLTLLEAAVTGSTVPFQEPVGRFHEQVPFRPPAQGQAPLAPSPLVGEGGGGGTAASPPTPTLPHKGGGGKTGVAVTFSGGVGELIYGHLQGKPWPPTTHYGDLGIDLAQRIVASPVWAHHLQRYRPDSAGRATGYGLLRHRTEVSGSTLFLPRPELLPLTDVPILGSVTSDSDDAQLRNVFALVMRSARGGCVQVGVGGQGAAAVAALGKKIAAALREVAFPATHPLVLLVRENVGKVLGHYVTEWGAAPLDLVVIDEVAPRNAQYTQIGAAHGPVVPVFFYGLNE